MRFDQLTQEQCDEMFSELKRVLAAKSADKAAYVFAGDRAVEQLKSWEAKGLVVDPIAKE